MTFPLADLAIAFRVTDRANMDLQLDEAVDRVRIQAMIERRRGILVTRRGHDTFRVTLSDSVPFGLTREHQEW
ncbi:hypothetical protein D9M72_107900 [compost metagenome]